MSHKMSICLIDCGAPLNKFKVWWLRNIFPKFMDLNDTYDKSKAHLYNPIPLSFSCLSSHPNQPSSISLPQQLKDSHSSRSGSTQIDVDDKQVYVTMYIHVQPMKSLLMVSLTRLHPVLAPCYYVWRSQKTEAVQVKSSDLTGFKFILREKTALWGWSELHQNKG